MKTIRSMVLAIFTFLSSMRFLNKKEKVTTTTLPVNENFIPSISNLFKNQILIIDTTLHFLRALPKNKLNDQLVSNAHFISSIQSRILNDQSFDPNQLHTALQFCNKIRAMQTIQ